MLRKILSNIFFIHGLVLLGLLALWGYIESDNEIFDIVYRIVFFGGCMRSVYQSN